MTRADSSLRGRAELGPLMFRKSGPLSATIMIALFTLLAAIGAVRYASSVTTYDRVLGAVLVLVAIGLGVLTFLLGSMRWEIYRDGVVQHRMGKTTLVRFNELAGYSYLELKGGLNGPDVWLMGFTAASGIQVTVRVQPDLIREKELPALNALLIERLAKRFREEFARGHGVAWGDARLRKEGLEIRGRMVPYARLTARSHEAMRDGVAFEEVELIEQGQVVATFKPGIQNHQIALQLFHELASGADRTTS